MGKEIPTRQEDYSLWYNELVKKADLAEQTKIFLAMIVENLRYRFRLRSFDLGVEVNEFNHQTSSQLLAECCFAGARHSDEKYLHDDEDTETTTLFCMNELKNLIRIRCIIVMPFSLHRSIYP